MKVFLIAALVGLLAGLTYWMSPVTHSPDSRWVLPTAHSIVTEGNIGLNEYRPLIKRIGTYGLRKKNREYVNFFPVGPALIAAPLVWLIARFPEEMSRVLRIPLDGTGESLLRHRRVVEHLLASLVAGVAVGLCFLTVSSLVSTGWALALTVAVGWGSPLWSVASRGMWQHGPALMCLFGALALLVRLERGERRPDTRWWGLALGVVLSLSYLMRPTTILALATLGAFLLVRHRVAALWALFGGALIAVPFLWCNLERYGHLLPPYYRGAELAFSGATIEALFANLVSPSRGILVLSAWTVGALLALSRKKSLFVWSLWLWCLLHLVIVSMFDRWWGGHSFGPRFMSEVFPPLVVLTAWGLWARGGGGRLTRVSLAGLIACSILAHAPGALSYTTVMWNSYPRNIDLGPERIWSVSRMQSAAPLFLKVRGDPATDPP